jgi:hypothetical protein
MVAMRTAFGIARCFFYEGGFLFQPESRYIYCPIEHLSMFAHAERGRKHQTRRLWAG